MSYLEGGFSFVIEKLLSFAQFHQVFHGSVGYRTLVQTLIQIHHQNIVEIHASEHETLLAQLPHHQLKRNLLLRTLFHFGAMLLKCVGRF